MTLSVTVIDHETGDTDSKTVIDNDYIIITNGTCYVSNIQVYPKAGTHVITVKGRK